MTRRKLKPREVTWLALGQTASEFRLKLGAIALCPECLGLCCLFGTLWAPSTAVADGSDCRLTSTSGNSGALCLFLSINAWWEVEDCPKLRGKQALVGHGLCPWGMGVVRRSSQSQGLHVNVTVNRTMNLGGCFFNCYFWDWRRCLRKKWEKISTGTNYPNRSSGFIEHVFCWSHSQIFNCIRGKENFSVLNSESKIYFKKHFRGGKNADYKSNLEKPCLWKCMHEWPWWRTLSI